MDLIKERKPHKIGDAFVSFKRLAKVFIKSTFRGRYVYPYQKISFDKLLRSERDQQNRIYNRIENVHFKHKLCQQDLVVYRVQRKWKDSNLFLEGEKGRSYRINQHHITDTPDVYCYSLGNAGVAGAEGFIYDTKRKKFIEETLRRWFSWDRNFINSYLTSFEKKAAVELTGICLSIAKPGSDSYYHFLHESVPIYLLLKKKFPQIAFDHVIVNGEQKAFKENWLQFIGINKNSVRFTNYSSHYKCEQLLFVSDLSYQYSPNPLTVNLLKALIRDDKRTVASGSGKRILASRQNCSVRNLDWEDELAKKAGAEIIDFERLSPDEVIEICQSCELFIGPHGAAFANIVFCNPGTRIIEIAFGMNEVLYGRLADICGLDYILFDVSQKEELFSHLEELKMN